jgi:hypothetical protein
MSDHITGRAGFLAALSRLDPERRAAEEHARSCPDCRDSLDEGARLVSLLEDALPLPPPTAETLAHAAATIAREAADERAAVRRLGWWSAGAVVVAWLFQLMVGGGFVFDARHAAVSLLVLAVSVAAVTLSRGRRRFAVAVMIATSLLLAHLAATSTGLSAAIGIRCMFRELWAAVIPWAVVPMIARLEGVSLRRWDVTAVAVGGALAAHAGQHVACRVPHSDAHLFVFHLGGVLLATVLAMITARGRLLLARR